MDDLIKNLMEKFDLPLDKVKGILSTVAGFLGDKLPDPIGSTVKGFLDGDDDGEGGGFDLGSLTDTLGGFFGGDDDK
ncbi:hypothetical protein HQ535_08825 [bacterium]|nr:hypothetical protein [bacterium]